MSPFSYVRQLAGKPVSRILLGSLVGQGAVIAISPVLTRLYSPADFGAFALVTAVVATLTGVVSLSWERAIVIPKESSTAAALAMLGVISSLCSGGLLAVVGYVGRHTWSEVFNTAVLVDFWWLIPVTVTVIGVQAQLSSWMVRRKRYGSLAGVNGTMGLGQAVSSVVLGLLGAVPLGLLLSLAVGRFTSVLTVGLREIRSIPLRQGWSSLASAATRYRRFPLVNTWSRLVNSLGLQLPVILLIAFYGDIQTGLYALTLRAVASPVGILVDATSQYFEATFADRVRRQSRGLVRQIRRFSSRMALVGIAPTLLILLVAPNLFSVVFGDEWREAGRYAQIVVVAYWVQFSIVPISRTLTLLERQLTQLVWDTARAIATVSVVVACAALGVDFGWCIGLLSVAHVLSYLVLLRLSLVAARAAEAPPRPPTGCENP